MTRARLITLQVTISVILLAASVGIVSRVPKITGSSWHEVTRNLQHISIGTTFLILGLWLAGLAVYTIAMVASMPGLTHRRAMALNLAGSSAANLLPFGGVIGTGINVAMIRSWRLSLGQFAGSAAVLNVANLVTKLSLPIIAGVVVSHKAAASPWLGRSAYIASVLAAIVMIAIIVALVSRRWAERTDALLHRLSKRFRRRKRPAGQPVGHVVLLQDQIREVVRRRWLGLASGMIGYVLLQWALFALCVYTAGLRAPVSVVFAAFAVERALTLAVVTPAGTGIAEAAATGLLVALGYSPAASATGVLLYRLFVYLAEIPVGVVVLGAWASRRVGRARAYDEAHPGVDPAAEATPDATADTDVDPADDAETVDDAAQAGSRPIHADSDTESAVDPDSGVESESGADSDGGASADEPVADEPPSHEPLSDEPSSDEPAAEPPGANGRRVTANPIRTMTNPPTPSNR